MHYLGTSKKSYKKVAEKDLWPLGGKKSFRRNVGVRKSTIVNTLRKSTMRNNIFSKMSYAIKGRKKFFVTIARKEYYSTTVKKKYYDFEVGKSTMVCLFVCLFE